MGQLDNICARSLWYPDWKGANKECVDNGNEPTYMQNNPSTYLSSQKQDCCQKHYSWDYNNCVGAKKTQNFGKYYPDFDGTKHVCVNDGLQPMYMDLSSAHWMYDTLKECCATHYSWNYDECLGSNPNAPVVNDPATYNKWFPGKYHYIIMIPPSCPHFYLLIHHVNSNFSLRLAQKSPNMQE